jgi:rubrerythrin
MDLGIYSLSDLILTGLKSEIDSKEVYTRIGKNVKNFMLKDRFDFLAGEEEKHRQFFEWLFHQTFPDKKIIIPDKSPVPLPQIIPEDVDEENVDMLSIIKKAMEAEKAAYEFYTEISDQFDELEIKKMLRYIASMEMGHYKILEGEKENIEKYEEFDVEWPMMHIGP